VVVIAAFTLVAFAVGVVPWLLLAIDETREAVACLKVVRYNLWGWLLVVFLCGCAVNELRKWKTPWKAGSRPTRAAIIMFSLPVLIFNALFFWALSVVAHFTP